MSIPLDRLYTHLNNLCNRDNVLISRWLPHGSKKASDLHQLSDYPREVPLKQRVGVICHDQEPLQFDFYQCNDIVHALQMRFLPNDDDLVADPKFKEIINDFHLRAMIGYPLNHYSQTLLVHSELHSAEADKYSQHNFIPIYWWAHGAIAQDWFRYADHDLRLDFTQTKFAKTFLVYCRAWSGTRQYRLSFLQDIKDNNLCHHATVNFGAQDGEQHYSSIWHDHTLDQYFNNNTAPSSASADYSSDDYHQCALELVLETVYESQRIHLTEKTCRPLACGKPFILAAGPRSLETLRNYGFETFYPWINEDYDLESDCNQRRAMIVKEMTRLSQLPLDSVVWQELHQIAARNRKRFFSEEFLSQLFDEFTSNFEHAYSQLTVTEKYETLMKSQLEHFSKNPEFYRLSKQWIMSYQ